MEQVNVGIIGFGTVGAGTVEVLLNNRDVISSRVGSDIIVKKIADLDLDSDRGIPLESGLLTREAMEVIEDPDIHVVVELMGGIDQAKDYILKAMENGKHVVTANKALLAEFGEEIYQAADDHGVSIAFEASVGGGIPVIRSFREGLSANRIQTIMGILNGTSNYILTRMTERELPYDEASWTLPLQMRVNVIQVTNPFSSENKLIKTIEMPLSEIKGKGSKYFLLPNQSNNGSILINRLLAKNIKINYSEKSFNLDGRYFHNCVWRS